MKYIKEVLSQLKKQKELHKDEIFNYVVPSLWDNTEMNASYTYRNEKIVNPYTFYYENILSLCNQKEDLNYLRPLSQIQNKKTSNGNWIKEASVYAAMIRTSAAYDHDHDGYLTQSNLYTLKEHGTFLKFICLIPHLKKLGINTLYLLPFYKTSKFNKKGEFASCYALDDHFKLNEELKDPLLDMCVEEQFAAFMELCHMHEIRVIIDILPRTCAIRSSLLKEHPDWFYWIDKKDAFSFKPPYIDSFNNAFISPQEAMKKVYENKECQRFLKHFRHDPRTLDFQKYKKIVETCEKEHLDLLETIEREYNITIACAFSDFINDSQNVWSDITYLKMYMDAPKEAIKYIDLNQPPYILYDVAKSSTYPGTMENRALWNLIGDIIPYYQKNYGIDGVRIDMAHALPERLCEEMIQKARNVDSDICFIAEEMNIHNAYKWAKQGFNLIWGNSFSEMCRIQERRLHSFYYNTQNIALPIFAMCENHDTPRASNRIGKRTFTDLASLVNLFTPNGVPFINAGQEFYEIQPMNLGIDCTKEEQWVLDPKDFRYGKLALFESYAFLYNEETFIDKINAASLIRKEYLHEITTPSCCVNAWFDSPNDACIGSWFIKDDRVLLMVANVNLFEDATYNVHFINVADKFKFIPTSIDDRFSTHKQYQKSEFLSQFALQVHLAAGEVKLIELK